MPDSCCVAVVGMDPCFGWISVFSIVGTKEREQQRSQYNVYLTVLCDNNVHLEFYETVLLEPHLRSTQYYVCDIIYMNIFFLYPIVIYMLLYMFVILIELWYLLSTLD